MNFKKLRFNVGMRRKPAAPTFKPDIQPQLSLIPPEWLAKIHPQVLLLSKAPGDRQGLPSPETFEALQGYSLLRTDRNGWIYLTTDGERMRVEAERE